MRPRTVEIHIVLDLDDDFNMINEDFQADLQDFLDNYGTSSIDIGEE